MNVRSLRSWDASIKQASGLHAQCGTGSSHPPWPDARQWMQVAGKHAAGGELSSALLRCPGVCASPASPYKVTALQSQLAAP